MQVRGEEFDFNHLIKEACSRWLKPAEVHFILQNNDHYEITEKLLDKPPSGSLYLFNKRTQRFFRKDGHNWRKKRDGKTVGEAHERLKVGNVDALNCYYAHGQDNPNFQRRCYWMLDGAYEPIVLVHYRDVTEGRSNSTSRSDAFRFPAQQADIFNAQNLGPNPGSSEVYNPSWSSFSPGSGEEVSSHTLTGTEGTNLYDDNSANAEVNQTLRKIALQLSVDNADDNSLYFLENLPSNFSDNDTCHGRNQSAYEGGNTDQDGIMNLPPSEREQWEYSQHLNTGKQPVDGLNRNSLLNSGEFPGPQPSQSLVAQHSTETPGLPTWNTTGTNFQSVGSATLPIPSFPQLSMNRTNYYLVDKIDAAVPTGFHKILENEMPLYSSELPKILMDQAKEGTDFSWQLADDPGKNATQTTCSSVVFGNIETQNLIAAANEILFGPDDHISSTSEAVLPQVGQPKYTSNSSESNVSQSNSSMDILGKSDGFAWMDSTEIACNTTYSSEVPPWFSQERYLETLLSDASSGLTVAAVQRFKIHEISPEWAYSTEGSKVLIIGEFLEDPSKSSWCCMFRDIEVPAEIIHAGVLRCQAPPHVTGKVTLCITCGNREACSEVREFEYRFKPDIGPVHSQSQAEEPGSRDELLLLLRFGQMLICGKVQMSEEKEASEDSLTALSQKLQMPGGPWSQMAAAISAGNATPSFTMNWLLEEFSKVKLEEWLKSKSKEGEALSKLDQEVIHMIAGLGYEWALNLVLRCGVGINFRDAHGWTALHWAARFGREKMVPALIAAGALPGARTDPTSSDSAGETAASIAATYGHKGLAAYLSEMDLTNHLASLTLTECEITKGSAAVEAEKTIESVINKSTAVSLGAEDDTSLKVSLEAVRNAAQAAARIQAAFRAHSFRRRRRHEAESVQDEYGMTPSEIQCISAKSRSFHNLQDYGLHNAALHIQKKYRGWKGRQKFLNLRKNVVRIQAHVRGHQVRKKYKKLLWAAGVLEKAILRWRRKGVGLRGFKADLESIEEEDEEDIARLFRKEKVELGIDQALKRVLSMVDSPRARSQYLRIIDKYRDAKTEFGGFADEGHMQGDDDNMGDDDMN
ncbi:calmodulin-binding transcription activator 4 [Amborella trichopoda]|uniref:calmodulin-binding transcription activator 4 n=1 Tax=Amborella trichopoda TaxID=13333 RepID=UPI0009BF3089|nr:calmodulin-binding transcription activator 4 [Amborella trichopoda]|eukprot:XP_020525450.1 calmodulin-binding transcription activator 4 [Amborella trichopoda]